MTITIASIREELQELKTLAGLSEEQIDALAIATSEMRDEIEHRSHAENLSDEAVVELCGFHVHKMKA